MAQGVDQPIKRVLPAGPDARPWAAPSAKIPNRKVYFSRDVSSGHHLMRPKAPSENEVHFTSLVPIATTRSFLPLIHNYISV